MAKLKTEIESKDVSAEEKNVTAERDSSEVEDRQENAVVTEKEAPQEGVKQPETDDNQRRKGEAAEKNRPDTESASQTKENGKGEKMTEVGVKETAELEPKVESEKKVEVEGERETTAAAEETTKVKTGEETESQDKVKSEVKKKVDTEGESADEDEVKEPSEDKFDKKIEVEAEEKAEAKEIGTLTEEKAEKIGEPEGNEEERPISKAIQEMTKSVVSVGNGGDVLAMCAKDIMRKDVVWGTPDDSVEESFKKMQQCDIGYILVGQDGIPEGIVSKSDITGAISPYLRPMFARWRRPLDDATLQIRIKWIMSRPVYTVRPDTPISVIMESVCRYSQRGLPVVDEEGRVQGLITVFDIFRALIGEKAGVSSESRPS